MINYSAGGISKDFWFLEFKKISQLYNDGWTESGIKQKNIDENIVNAPSLRRSKEIVNVNLSRIRRLDKSYLDLFFNTTLENQKLITLISILLEDKLFFEFVNEVYREKLLLGETHLKQSDLEKFFDFKRTQSERVNQWTESTVRQLMSYYLNNLVRAGLLKEEDKQYIIQKPYISVDLKDWLDKNDLAGLYGVLLGE